MICNSKNLWFQYFKWAFGIAHRAISNFSWRGLYRTYKVIAALLQTIRLHWWVRGTKAFCATWFVKGYLEYFNGKTLYLFFYWLFNLKVRNLVARQSSFLVLLLQRALQFLRRKHEESWRLVTLIWVFIACHVLPRF